MKKKLEKDNKMNIYSLPMMNKVASTTIWNMMYEFLTSNARARLRFEE